MSIRNALLALATSLCLSTVVFADTLALNPNHPETYVVVKGDTLWDISAKFLRDPWLWPEIWYINPDIENPHLIYPGDTISLVYRNGKPVLEVQRGRPTVKLSPTARSTHLKSAISTVPASTIAQFLTQPRILSKEQIDAAGYISLGDEDHIISGTGNTVYVSHLKQDENKNFSIYHIGNVYRNPQDKDDILGYEGIHVADAQMSRGGDPATLLILKSYRESRPGDKVLPSDDSASLNQNFTPHSPPDNVSGEIISILDGMARAGQYQTVVIDLGKKDGMELGHVLAVRQKGKIKRDTQANSFFKPEIQLPDERAGLLMVVNVFDRLSYALVMNAVRDIREGDLITKP
jgi:hypothetical protein